MAQDATSPAFPFQKTVVLGADHNAYGLKAELKRLCNKRVIIALMWGRMSKIRRLTMSIMPV